MKNKCYIFADESNTDKSRFMLIGGIWVDDEICNKVVFECQKFKLENNWSKETKFNWKNISKKTLQEYCNFIDIFFKYNLRFNCVIIDRKKVNFKNNKERDSELGFYQLYYEFIKYNSKQNVPYYIYLDRRNNKHSGILNTMRQKLEVDFNIKTLEFVNSNTYDLIQFSDLILGSIGYHYNKKHVLPQASRHKSAFAMHIANKIEKEDLIFDTDISGHKNFNLWLYKQ